MLGKKKQFTAPPIPTSPQWETRSMKPLVDGRVPGVDGSLWLYRSVPLSSITDAKTTEDMLAGGRGLSQAFEELAKMATPGINRTQSKASYREFHVLLLNVPTYYSAPEESPIRGYLNSEFRDRFVQRRELLFGVKLTPTASDGGVKKAWDSFIYTLMYTGTMMTEYDRDTDEVSAALARAGFTVPSKETLRWADSWWSHGRSKGVPTLRHDDHLHYITQMSAKYEIEDHHSTASCRNWPEAGIPGEFAISYTALRDLDIGYTEVTDPLVRWAPRLIDSGARVISVRGLVEPQKVTRAQLRSQKQKIRADIQEYHENNKTPRDEQEEGEANLAQMEGSYARGEAPATLMDTSVIIGFDGVQKDVRKITPPGVELDTLTDLQPAAWYETMLCSNVRANPHKQDLPQTTISFAALANLSKVGDSDGALLGFTESDGQPVYISASAASRGDSFPLFLVAGSTGSGKSLCLQWMAHSWGLAKVPQIIVDPKQKSDFSASTRASGGSVSSFDDLVDSDGPLDPIRYNPDRALGVQDASDMISRVRPLSTYDMDSYETPIANALRYGVERGAEASGQALRIAANDGVIPLEIVEQIEGFAQTYPMFRATYGMHPGQSPVMATSGITLFKVGDSKFSNPAHNAGDIRFETPAIRTSVNVMKQIVRAAVTNLSGRGGVLHIDEAWVYEKAAPDELIELGRLARSQNVLVVLYTQTPKGPLSLGLGGFISRGLIGHIPAEGEDTSQASAGIKLFGSESPQILRRIVAREKESGANNWNSLKALWDVDSGTGERTLVRPAVWYHADLSGNIAPVEVKIPDSFFKLASTNPDDIAAREKEERMGIV